jgi:hypothetical protein
MLLKTTLLMVSCISATAARPPGAVRFEVNEAAIRMQFDGSEQVLTIPVHNPSSAAVRALVTRPDYGT